MKPLLDALAASLDKTAADYRAGDRLVAQAEALQSVIRFCKANGIKDESVLPLFALWADLADTEQKEQNRQVKPVKKAIDEATAIAAVDLLMESGMDLSPAAAKVGRAVPGLGLTGKKLVELRKNVGKGKARPEVAEQRRVIRQAAKDNGWAPDEAAKVLLENLRLRCPVEKKG